MLWKPNRRALDPTLGTGTLESEPLQETNCDSWKEHQTRKYYNGQSKEQRGEKEHEREHERNRNRNRERNHHDHHNHHYDYNYDYELKRERELEHRHDTAQCDQV